MDIATINSLSKYLDQIQDIPDNLSDVTELDIFQLNSGNITYHSEIVVDIEKELKEIKYEYNKCLITEQNHIKLSLYSDLLEFNGVPETEDFCMKKLRISLKKKQEILHLYTDYTWRKNQSNKMYYEDDISNFEKLLNIITDIDSTEEFHKLKKIKI